MVKDKPLRTEKRRQASATDDMASSSRTAKELLKPRKTRSTRETRAEEGDSFKMCSCVSIEEEFCKIKKRFADEVPHVKVGLLRV